MDCLADLKADVHEQDLVQSSESRSQIANSEFTVEALMVMDNTNSCQ